MCWNVCIKERHENEKKQEIELARLFSYVCVGILCMQAAVSVCFSEIFWWEMFCLLVPLFT